MNRLNKFFFDGLSLPEVAKFFIRGLWKGDIQTRSNSMAFTFFMALFPSLIFLFTLIPYVPIDNFQVELLSLIQSFTPKQSYEAVHETIEDIVKNKRGGILSIGFFSALFFSTNGVLAMIEGFSKSYHEGKRRSGFQQRMVAIFLTMLITLLTIIAIALLVSHQVATQYVYNHHFLNKAFYFWILNFGKFFISIALSFTAISCLYYFGPSRHKRFKFISAGSTLATILILLTSVLFNYVVSNFLQYNKLYGSIGALIVVMLYIKFNSLQLLIGFELNASIENVKRKSELHSKEEPIPLN